jgi:hypothetical protein
MTIDISAEYTIATGEHTTAFMGNASTAFMGNASIGPPSYTSYTFQSAPVGQFGFYGECHYCNNESNKNMSLLGIMICEGCFKKALDLILKKSLNSKLIGAIKAMSV